MAENVHICNDRTQKHRGENVRIITHQNCIENARHGKWQNGKYQIIKWQNGKGTAQYMIENTHTRKWQKIHIGKMQEQICTILKLVENAAI